MKKLTFVLLALSMAVTACDSNTDSQLNEEAEASSNINPIDNTAVAPGAGATSADEAQLISPEDLSSEAQEVTFQTIFDYNQCMVKCQLSAAQEPEDARRSVSDILTTCETHMDDLSMHLLDHNVDELLVMDMIKNVRSRATRNLLSNL